MMKMTDLITAFLIMVQTQLFWVIYKTAKIEQRLKDLKRENKLNMMEMINDEKR